MPQAPNPISETATPDRPSCRWRTLVVAGEQALGFFVEAVELAFDAQLDQNVLVGRPEDVEPLRRMAVLCAALLDVARLVDEEALDVGEHREAVGAAADEGFEDLAVADVTE